MTRVAPLAPPWSERDAADINSWGHPDRTYEPLLLVRCLQRHPAHLCAGALRVRVGWAGSVLGPIAGVSDDECDALVTGGWYRTICTLCNGLALPVEDWMRRWPESAD